MSDNNVIPFKSKDKTPPPPEEPTLFACGECNNKTYLLTGDGLAECAACGATVNNVTIVVDD